MAKSKTLGGPVARLAKRATLAKAARLGDAVGLTEASEDLLRVSPAILEVVSVVEPAAAPASTLGSPGVLDSGGGSSGDAGGGDSSGDGDGAGGDSGGVGGGEGDSPGAGPGSGPGGDGSGESGGGTGGDE